MIRKFFIAFMLVFASVCSAIGQDAREVMKERVTAYFDAYTSHLPEMYAKWLEENRTEEAFAAAPLDARLEMYSFDAQRWGGLELSNIEYPEPFLAVAEAQPKNGGMPIRVIFQFQDTEPFLVGPMMIGLAFDVPQDWSSLENFADQVIDKSGIPALAIGVMKDGEVVDEAVRGVRQLGEAAAVDSGDTFHWGSIAKSVTGTMIAKLVENGDLKWDTTVSDVLSDMPMRDEYRSATISQLMSHEAGIQPYTNFDQETVAEIVASAKGDSMIDKRRSFVEKALNEEPLGMPGTVHAYSNAGITVAGLMAETVTGKPWRALVEEHVFKPAGMSTAGFDWPAAPDRPDQPVGHWGDSRSNYEAMQYGQMLELLNIAAPAGNIRSSLDDLMRYGNYHLAGMNGADGYVKSETMKYLHTPREDSVSWGGGWYTFGWGHHECSHFVGEPECQAHNGGAGSFYAEIKLLPEENMVLAYMANAAEPSEAIAQDVLASVYAKYSGSE